MSRIYDIDLEPKHPPKFTDMLGQEVRIGDTVAYAIRDGNLPALKVGTLTQLWWVEGAGWDFRVVATFQSGHNDVARVLTGRKPSQPSRGRMVRIAKGGNW
jgi:hypothetical protein